MLYGILDTVLMFCSQMQPLNVICIWNDEVCENLEKWLLKRETIFIGQTFYEGKEEEEEEEGELETDCCCNESDLLFWCDWAMSCWFVWEKKTLWFYTNYSNKLAG